MSAASWRAYFRLIRLPNLATALADVLAGGCIALAAQTELSRTRFLPLLLTSAGLYLSALAFNDIADRQEDAQFRPERPLPSGAVTLRGALLSALFLLALALLSAGMTGAFTLQLSLAITLCFLAYDFWAKQILLLGPLCLGICRCLNFTLGLSLDPQLNAHLYAGQWTRLYPALAIGIYAAGLTAFSTQEEQGRKASALVLGWSFCGGALFWAFLVSPQSWSLLLLLPLTTLLLRRTQTLLKLRTSAAARELVLSGVLGICALDGALILGHLGLAGWTWALLSLSLLWPARLLAKWLAQREA